MPGSDRNRKTNLPPERMTPIRVRGKKGQKARLRALQNQRMEQTASEDFNMLDTSLPPPRSRLESLPTELLESIFLYSLDVNLPRASPLLGEALSSTYVKQKLLHILLVRPDGADEQNILFGKLQSRLLTCRWLDLGSVYRALAAAYTPFLEQSLPDLGTGFVESRPVETVPSFMSNVSQLVNYVFAHSHDNETAYWSFGPSERVDLRITRTEIIFNSSIRGFRFHMSRGCEMPTRLLHGPWTAEKMEFCSVLLEAGASLDPCGSNNAEVADQSLREAIIQGNTDVVSLLRQEWHVPGGHSSKLKVTLDHVRLAIFQGGCKPEILDLLARPPQLGYGMDDCLLDWKQEDILDWANERIDSGDERGLQLLELMHSFQRNGRIG
ncbi:MAG: hypothetical protein Q9177_005962 [Variospora cf. flavescens]